MSRSAPATRCGLSAMDAIEEFMQIFVDQCAFIDYFKSHTLAIIGIFQLMLNLASIWRNIFSSCSILHLAKVLSQTDRNLVYTIWNSGSEFSLCDCSWSRLGNICKHVIEVATFCRSRQIARPLLFSIILQTIL
jgi:hypothetical protein